MNRMEINGPGAEFKINMKKILSGETIVNRVDANKSDINLSNRQQDLNTYQRMASTQNTRWMERYFLSLLNITEQDTITICGNLDEYGMNGHRLGSVPLRPNMDPEWLKRQGEIITNITGLELYDYIDVASRIRTFALKIPFHCVNRNVTVDVDKMENSYIITISELEFKQQCNEAIKQFLLWCDARGEQNISQDYLFLKRFCDIPSDRVRFEAQKQAAYEIEQKRQEQMAEWETRTWEYVKTTDWTSIGIGLEFAMADTFGASVELYLEGLPQNDLLKAGILLPEKLYFLEEDQGIMLEKQLTYFPESFKTRVLCAMAKYMNEEYQKKQPEVYAYKKWHTLCERRDFSMKFSRKFTYYSEEQLGIVQGEGISFAEWERNMVPGGYEHLFED